MHAQLSVGRGRGAKGQKFDLILYLRLCVVYSISEDLVRLCVFAVLSGTTMFLKCDKQNLKWLILVLVLSHTCDVILKIGI